MRAAGMTVVLAMYWLAGVVGAASLPPDDQYSPQQSPYKRDAARGPRGYPNWLEYHQDSSTGLEPPENKPAITSLRASDLSRDKKTEKDSVTRDLNFLSLAPGGWNVATADLMKNFTGSRNPDLDVPEDGLEISSASLDDPFETDDTFQDQGPGSVEVYKLDLRRENSLLVPQAKRKQPTVVSRIKSKIPKKAKGEEILWKLKPIEPSKSSLATIFRQPASIYPGETISRVPLHRIEENRKDEVFAVGGVPELQVGCEGLEASDRKKRSSGPGEEEDSDEEFWPKFKDPVYRESTEPILLRVTPIVLDFEDEPPAGQTYEELDELLKLKSSTTTEATTKRANRGDIDPALENYNLDEVTPDETLPERGDLGPNSSNGSSRVKRSIQSEDIQESKVEDVSLPTEANRNESSLTAGLNGKDDDTLAPIIGRRSESSNQPGGRKLLWVQYPESHENQARTRHHQGYDEHEEPDLWGFGEDDGEKISDEDETEADKLRKVEVVKRRREYERRRQEDLERRRGGHGRRPQTEELPSRAHEVHSEIERIRKEYEREQEKEQRERQRVEEQWRRQEERRQQGEEEQRRIEEAERQQTEELQRRMKEEERRNRDPSHHRRREEEERRRELNRRREEQERRVRLEYEQNNQVPPSPLTKTSPHNRPENRSRSQQEEDRKEAEERKLREYIERNRPINVKKSGDHRRPEDHTRRRHEEDEEKRKYIETQRRRLIEEERRKHQEELESRRQMEEQRRRQTPDEDERRRQMEEQRRRDRPDNDRTREEERRRRLEEERRLQEYVRRNQPVNVPSWNSSQERDLQEQRRTIDEARQWEHNRQQNRRTNDGRSHGPSAPTNIGQRQSQSDLEKLRRRQEAERLEAEQRRFQEEGRRREEEYRRQESRRREEDRQRLESARQREEANRRRPNWQDSRRPTNSSHNGSEVDRRIPSNSRRNQEDEWRRRSEERERQRQQHEYEERERLRIQQEINDRNNGRRRPQHEDTRPSEQRQRGESVRNQEETERRRREEEARLLALPVSARIIVRSDEESSRGGRTSPPGPLVPPSVSIGTRDGFGNTIDFPAINPERPGLAAMRFPAPRTPKPPIKSPSACTWAIVNCCPANNRLTTCFESMGCPGVNWDPSPCRASLQSAARAQVLSFYESAEADFRRA